jgi:hypothetical protein
LDAEIIANLPDIDVMTAGGEDKIDPRAVSSFSVSFA